MNGLPGSRVPMILQGYIILPFAYFIWRKKEKGKEVSIYYALPCLGYCGAGKCYTRPEGTCVLWESVTHTAAISHTTCLKNKSYFTPNNRACWKTGLMSWCKWSLIKLTGCFPHCNGTHTTIVLTHLNTHAQRTTLWMENTSFFGA